MESYQQEYSVLVAQQRGYTFDRRLKNGDVLLHRLGTLVKYLTVSPKGVITENTDNYGKAKPRQ